MRDETLAERLDALIEAYLQGEVPRETILSELGAERLAEIEYQRDALQRDVEWGLELPSQRS
jgi:hypothetical protein